MPADQSDLPEPVSRPPAEFSALIARDWKVYGEAIRIANVKVE